MGGVLRLSDFEALPLHWLWCGRILIGPYSSFAYKYFIHPHARSNINKEQFMIKCEVMNSFTDLSLNII